MWHILAMINIHDHNHGDVWCEYVGIFTKKEDAMMKANEKKREVKLELMKDMGDEEMGDDDFDEIYSLETQFIRIDLMADI